MTKVEKFNAIKAIVADNAELVAFCDHEIEILQKQRSSATKKKNTANDGLKATILEVLANQNAPMRNSELTKAINAVSAEDVSPNKISALLTQLKNDGKVERTEVKKIAYFSVPRD